MKRSFYKPPFTISSEMLNKSISISSKIERILLYKSLEKRPVILRNNRIKSIHSSLAIEANSLSLNEVKDVIDGKTVAGKADEIQDVKNAFKAYKMIEKLNPYSEEDLLKAHGILTYLVNDESGTYRNHAEGVVDGRGNIIHVAPPANMVQNLMNDLFYWLRNDNETPLLIKSCIFHYELVFIHPFGDGNGRTARLWQTVILTKWNKLFEYIPIESLIYKYQNQYYTSIRESNGSGNSNAFIEFMLIVIDETLDSLLNEFNMAKNNISEQVNRLLSVLEYDLPLSANEIMYRLGIKSKETLRGSYLNPAIKNGLVKMTLPDKRNSKNQKYYK